MCHEKPSPNTIIDLDKQSVSYTSVYGLIKDFKLVGSQFATTSSMFYVGQLVFEFSFIFLMSRFPFIKFVGITMWVAAFTGKGSRSPTNL